MNTIGADSDPFADENFSKTYSYIALILLQLKIDLTENGGAYLKLRRQ
jgi:hypothetical protein